MTDNIYIRGIPRVLGKYKKILKESFFIISINVQKVKFSFFGSELLPKKVDSYLVPLQKKVHIILKF